MKTTKLSAVLMPAANRVLPQGLFSSLTPVMDRCLSNRFFSVDLKLSNIYRAFNTRVNEIQI